jgi:hypothetical protein
MGHYAGALIPYGRDRSLPLIALLICAQLGDFLWLAFALVGVEPTSPSSFLDVSISSMQVDMLWSHALVPVLGAAVLAALVALEVYRRRTVALWCGALVVAHLVEDLLCGWRHELTGAGSPRIGFGLYEGPPGVYAAFVIEAVFAALCVAYFVRARRSDGQVIVPRRQAWLYAAFVGGSLLFAGNAVLSMREIAARLFA